VLYSRGWSSAWKDYLKHLEGQELDQCMYSIRESDETTSQMGLANALQESLSWEWFNHALQGYHFQSALINGDNDTALDAPINDTLY
jgi:hypothetical protein